MDHWPGYAQLMTARTTNGSDGAVPWAGGEGLLSVWGTPDGCMVQISFSPDNGTTFIDTDGASLLAAGSVRVAYPIGLLKATISSAGASTSMSVQIRSIGGERL